MIGDTDLDVRKLYGMLPAEHERDLEGRTAADNQTVRNVFVIGPDKKIKLILVYPMTTGRNFDEVLRVIDSLQLTAKHRVATPVNWKQGEDVIIAGSVSDDEAKKIYPDGWKAPKPYIRIVPQPLAADRASRPRGARRAAFPFLSGVCDEFSGPPAAGAQPPRGASADRCLLRASAHAAFNTSSRIRRSRACALVDPILDYDEKSGCTGTRSADALLAFVRERGLTVAWILDTHPHADHFSAAAYIKDRTGAKTGIGERIVDVQQLWKTIYNLPDDFRTDGSQWDHLFADGDVFRIGSMEARVLFSPGHTLASIAYLVGGEPPAAFGDIPPGPS